MTMLFSAPSPKQFERAVQNLDLIFTFRVYGSTVVANGISSVLTTILENEHDWYSPHHFSNRLDAICKIDEFDNGGGGTVRKVYRENDDPRITYDSDHTQQFVDEQITKDEQLDILLEFTEQFLVTLSVPIDPKLTREYLFQMKGDKNENS